MNVICGKLVFIFFMTGVQVAHFLLYCIAFVNSYVFLVGGTVLPVVLKEQIN